MHRAASVRLMQLSMASRPRRGLHSAASPSPRQSLSRTPQHRSLLTAPVARLPRLGQSVMRRQREPPVGPLPGPPELSLLDMRGIAAGTASILQRMAASSENGEPPTGPRHYGLRNVHSLF
jgi:hypothetical protein